MLSLATNMIGFRNITSLICIVTALLTLADASHARTRLEEREWIVGVHDAYLYKDKVIVEYFSTPTGKTPIPYLPELPKMHWAEFPLTDFPKRGESYDPRRTIVPEFKYHHRPLRTLRCDAPAEPQATSLRLKVERLGGSEGVDGWYLEFRLPEDLRTKYADDVVFRLHGLNDYLDDDEKDEETPITGRFVCPKCGEDSKCAR